MICARCHERERTHGGAFCEECRESLRQRNLAAAITTAPTVDLPIPATAEARVAARDPWEHNPGARPHPHPGTRTTHDPARADVLEADEQPEIIAFLVALGYTVDRIGQRNAYGTQDSGVFDLWATRPFDHRPLPAALWWDSKRPHGGRLSDEQAAFLARCRAAGVAAGWGSVADLRRFFTVSIEGSPR